MPSQRASHSTKTSTGLQVRTYALPPAKFNPLTASSRELQHYGLPPKPDETKSPQWRNLWERDFGRPWNWISPVFQETKGRSHRASRAARSLTRPVPELGEFVTTANACANPNWATPMGNSHWSGTMIVLAPGDSFQWIRGQWIVPHAHGHSTWEFASASQWIGIGGFEDIGLIQAGTDTDVFNGSGGGAYAWWEWLDADPVVVPNLFPFPGDVMYCLICAITPTLASIYLANVSARTMTWFTVTPPKKGAPIALDTAEWIVERPLDVNSNSFFELADYGLVYFDEAVAGTAGNQTRPLGSGASITMRNPDNNHVLSVPTLETDTLMKVRFVASI